MAAYAALVSLMNLIEQIRIRWVRDKIPIYLDREHAENLSERVAFLIDFLETYNTNDSNEEVARLQNRIADAGYAAEDIVEPHIVERMLFESRTPGRPRENIRTVDLEQGLLKVIEDMDSIKKEAMEIKEKTEIQDQSQRIIPTPDVSSKSPSMVGFDDVLIEVMDKLKGQQSKDSKRQIIPISGMGGIGKTTLARNVYKNPLIEQHFDFLAWVTISQQYNIREILIEVILHLKNQGSKESLSLRSERDLGLLLHKNLSGRRYLIVMDDMWSSDAWDEMKFHFPDNQNRSRILITTRISEVVLCLSDTYSLKLNFLDEDQSWILFCKVVFGEEGCPLELEKIGKKIAKKCKGLPLSIVVIGGLLKTTDRALRYWEYVAENLSSIVNLEEDECCLKILQTSYAQLPIHLKPCFLYIGMFPEDCEIRVSELIRMWVGEGFLKPIRGKILEEIAEKYLMDLIDRNLVLVTKRGTSGKMKLCIIHDLLRDLCLREAQKEKFLCVASQRSLDIPHEGINAQRRVAIFENTSNKEEYHQSFKSDSVTRSLVCYFQRNLPLSKLKLLRVLKSVGSGEYSAEQRNSSFGAAFKLVNLRYLCVYSSYSPSFSGLLDSIPFFWNLQTLVVQLGSGSSYYPVEIWKMPQLRHVKVDRLHLSYPPPSRSIFGHILFKVGNLHSLSNVDNFHEYSKDVVERFPHVKKLRLTYTTYKSNSLNDLGHLQELESLTCIFVARPSRADLVRNLNFPHSLKKLTVGGSRFYWKDMSLKIGCLPLLQVLKLYGNSFEGSRWETVGGQFPSLKYLLISFYNGLQYWDTEHTHFPRLEHLVLRCLTSLKEIPLDIGEIPTLKSIELHDCCDGVIVSAKRILDVQEEDGSDGFHVRVEFSKENDQHLERFASHNFHVIRRW